MVSASQANNAINLLFHVLILFMFLTGLFFLIISREEKETMEKQYDKAIKTGVEKFLSEIDEWSQKFGMPLDWEKVKQTGVDLQKENKDSSQKVVKNNKNLLILCVGIVAALFISIIFTYVYYRDYREYKIDIKHILIDNIIVFMFVGAIEYWFFLNVASKFVPVTPDIMGRAALDKLGDEFIEQLGYTQ